MIRILISDSDGISSVFAKVGFEKVFGFAGFAENADAPMYDSAFPFGENACEPLALGFAFESRKKGLPLEVEGALARLLPFPEESRIDCFFALSYGKKAAFNLNVLDKALSRFEVCLSFAAVIGGPGDAKGVEMAALDISDCAIRLAPRALFTRREAQRAVERIRAARDEIHNGK